MTVKNVSIKFNRRVAGRAHTSLVNLKISLILVHIVKERLSKHGLSLSQRWTDITVDNLGVNGYLEWLLGLLAYKTIILIVKLLSSVE